MDNKLLYRNKYDTLNIEEKKEVLDNIATHYGLHVVDYTLFENENKSLYTAIYKDESLGSEFVFIPGEKSVYLGWKKTISIKKEDTALIEYIKNAMSFFFISSIEDSHIYAKYRKYETLEQIKENVSEKEYALIDKYFTKLTLDLMENSTSFYRKVDIAPMLVERRSTSINWEYVKNILPSQVADSPTYFKIYQEIVKSGKSFLIKKSNLKSGSKKIQKFVIDDKGLLVYKYKELNYEEILFNYTSQGYNIATANQWEYMASCGSGSFFVNDNIFYSSKSISKHNGFGLYICSNIYEPEIISDNKFIFKGGDGGYFGYIHGDKMANFPLSPCHNTKSTDYHYMDENGLYVRKIINIDLRKKYKPKINKKNINKYIDENLTEDNYDNIIYAVNSINHRGISFENAVKIIEIYHNKGFINKSLELVELFKEEGRNNPEYLYLAGYTYFRMQNNVNAKNALNKAITIKRNMPECYQLLAYIYHKESLYDNMKSAFHNLFRLSPDIAKSMIPIIFPKGLSYEDMDFCDLWAAFLLSIAKESENKTMFNITDTSLISEIILLDSTIKLISNNGIKSYIKNIRQTGSIYLFKIFDKIENSIYVQENKHYLSKKDMEMAEEEFLACKNIIYEAETIDLKEVDEDYLQNLTNSFFDYSPALEALAYIHYSNCRVFEAQKLFDTEYNLCFMLYKAKNLPINIADGIRVLLEDFINNITINLYTYGQIQAMIEYIIEKAMDIKSKYAEKFPAYMYLIEKSLQKDLAYILEWFKIDMDVKTNIQKLK